MAYAASSLVHLASAAVLATVLVACSSNPDDRDPNEAIRNGVIIDDLRAPSQRNY